MDNSNTITVYDIRNITLPSLPIILEGLKLAHVSNSLDNFKYQDETSEELDMVS